MKTKVCLLIALILILNVIKVNAQQCLGGGCTNFTTQYPSGTFSTSSSSWIVVNGNNSMNAGNWTLFSVTSGNTYEWSYCESFGGVSTAWDAQLTLFNNNNLITPLCFSSDYCGTNYNAPYLSWTATFTGTVRILTTAYVSGGCHTNSGSPYNKLVWRQANAPCVPPSTPTGLTATAISSSQINLSWNVVSGAIGYDIYYCDGTYIAYTTNLTYSHTGRAENTTYSYKIDAQKSATCVSPLTSCVSATTLCNIPSTPTGLTATPVSSSQINLSWNVVSGAVGYNIYYCDGTYIAYTTNLTYSNTGRAENTTYSYKINAQKSTTCVSPLTSCVSATTLCNIPSTPTGLTATAISSSQINLSWNVVPGAVGYNIYYCDGTFIAYTTSINYSHTGRAENTTYSYKINAQKSATCVSPLTSCVSATTLCNIPSTPTGLTATAVSSSQINLSWNVVPGAIGYDIFYCDGTFIAYTTNINYSHTGRAENTTYSYKIDAQKSATCVSPLTSCVSATTLCNLPSTPTGLTATPVSSSQINLSWNVVPGAIGYNIYYCDGTFIAYTTSLTYSHTGRAENTTYSYKINAQKSATCVSPLTSCVSATTLCNIPSTPTGLTATAISSSQINLSWNVVPGAIGYDIYYCDGTFIAYTTNLTYSHTGRAENTTYSYKIDAQKSATCVSPLTSCVSATTLCNIPSAPTGLTATAISSSQINLSWNVVPGAIGYDIYYCDGTFIAYTTNLTYSHTGRVENTTYSYKIDAQKSATCVSPLTSCVSATTLCNIPSTPTGLTATAVSSSQINLSWNVVPGAIGYDIFYCDGTFIAYTTNINYSHTGRAENTTYSYKIDAQKSATCVSPLTSCVSATTFCNIPSTPTGLTATAVSSSQINLSWNVVPGAIGYDIFYCDGTFIAYTTNINYSHTGRAENTTYSYKIDAQKSATCVSPLTSCVSATTFCNLPLTPTGLTATAVSSSQINLSWNVVPGAIGYDIFYCDGTFITYTTNINYSHTGRAENTTYSYKIDAQKSATCFSPLTSCVSATTLCNLPSTPTGLTATPVSSSQINLSWNVVPGAIGYDIFYCDGTFITYTTNINYSHTGRAENTTYSYKIDAQKSATCVSPLTSCVSATTFCNIPSTPTGLTATAVSSSQINLNWNVVPGVIGYDIFYCDGTFIAYTTNTNYSHIGRAPNTTYSYKIDAQKSATCVSNLTGCVNATTFPVCTPPATPSGLTATAVSSYQINLIWNAPLGAIGYDIYYCDGTFIAYTTSTHFSHTGRIANTTYSYKIDAQKSATCVSFLTSCVSATTPCNLPTTPTGLTATAVSSSQINLNWNAVPGAIGYDIFYCDGTYITYTTNTNFIHTGRVENTTYAYKIDAQKSPTCISPLTSCMSATTFLMAPGSILIQIKDLTTGNDLNDATLIASSNLNNFYGIPNGTTGSYIIYVPYGYGYSILCTKPGYLTYTKNNVNVIQGQTSPFYSFYIQQSPNNYSVVPIVPDPNPPVSEVINGGTFHRYYRVMQANGQNAPGQWVELTSNNETFTSQSDQDGILDFHQPSSIIGTTGQSRNFSITKVNNVELITPVSFSCNVISPVYEKYWDNKVSAEIGISFAELDLSVESERGSIISIEESDQINSEPENIIIKRQGKGGEGIGFSIKSPSIGGQLGPIHGGIGAEAGLGAKFLGVTEDMYSFPYTSANNWEAVSKFILIADGGFKSLDNTLVRLLSICEKFFTDQNSIQQSFRQDAVGFDVVVNASASALAGISISRNQKLGLSGNIGREQYASLRFTNHYLENQTENTFALSGVFNVDAGIKFTTRAQITNPIKAKLDLFDYYSFRGLEFSVFQNRLTNSIEKYNVSFQKKSQSETEKLNYEITGTSLVNSLSAIHPSISTITQSLTSSISMDLYNNIFDQITDSVFKHASAIQKSGIGQAVINYSKEKSEIQEEDAFPLSIGLSLSAVGANFGAGLGFEGGKKMIIEEGKWINGTHYLNYNFDSPIPDINIDYQQVVQNTINDIPLWLRILIGAVQFILPGLDNHINLLGDQGSFVDIPDNSFPAGVDSISCTTWGWWGDTISSRPNKVPKDVRAIFSKNKSRAESLYGMTYGIGGFYQFEPYGVQMPDTCWLTIAYAQDEADSLVESSLAVYWEDKQNQKWVYLGGTVDTIANTVKVPFTKLALFTLAPRLPYGKFSLNAIPGSIYADSLSTALITSSTIFNNDSTIVSGNQLFTISTSLGRIVTTDRDENRPGVQIYPVDGMLTFQIASSNIGGSSVISAYSVTGSAHASDTIIMYDTIAPHAPHLYPPKHITENCGLSWSYSKEKDVTGFRVYFDTDTIPPFNGPVTVFGSSSPLNIGNDTSSIVYGLLPDSNYYMTVTAFDVNGNESDYSNIQPFHMIPFDRVIEDITFQPGQTDCRDGLDTITTGGNGQTCIIPNTSSVTLIAGKKITMMPGTVVDSGGYFHGYITTDNQFCDSVFIVPQMPQSEIQGNDDLFSQKGQQNQLFSLYPNPTTGKFILVLYTEPVKSPALVWVYDLMGNTIIEQEIVSGKVHEFSLDKQNPGIYLIRVLQNGEALTQKAIKL